ncbi:MAG: hypothetical protein AB7K04_09600 [Pseudorhodoplanes sp.]
MHQRSALATLKDVGARTFKEADDIKQYNPPQFGVGHHDGIQYHFFSGDKVFCLRTFVAPSLFHTSVWTYDGGVRELFNDNRELTIKESDHVDLESSDIAWKVDGRHGVIALRGKNEPLTVDFDVKHTLYWEGPSTGPVYHQPDLQARIAYKGRTYDAIGYCKRYWYDPPVLYWGYRFIQGPTDDRSYVLWTADATFNAAKYAYFKFLLADGALLAADIRDSLHRQDFALGTIDGVQYEVTLQELGAWGTILKSDRMDTQLHLRFCRMHIHFDGKSLPGYCINETGFGTIR